MASGSIVYDCPICGEYIWEDEEYCFDGDTIRHTKCDPNNVSKIADLYKGLSNREKFNLRVKIAKIDYEGAE